MAPSTYRYNTVTLQSRRPGKSKLHDLGLPLGFSFEAAHLAQREPSTEATIKQLATLSREQGFIMFVHVTEKTEKLLEKVFSTLKCVAVCNGT